MVGFAALRLAARRGRVGALPRRAARPHVRHRPRGGARSSSFVHSLLYAGFFEDPLTWGVLGLAAAGSLVRVSRDAPEPAPRSRSGRSGAAGTLTRRPARPAAAPCRKPSPGSSLRSPCSCSRSSGSRSASRSSTQDRAAGRARHRPRGRHRLAPTTSHAPAAGAAAEPEPVGDRRCWRTFGADPRRSLGAPGRDARPSGAQASLDARARRATSSSRPTTATATLYVNRVLRRRPSRSTRRRARISWTPPRRRHAALEPGDRRPARPRGVAERNRHGTRPPQRAASSGRCRRQARSSRRPVVVDGTALLRVARRPAVRGALGHGRIRWAYQTGGRINASPSVFGGRVCVTTYAGSFVCLDRRTGEEEWTTYLKRDAFRYESFYASPSSDGARLYSLSRAGTVYALDASSGRVVWRAGVGGLGYTTPAVAEGRVFAGGFDGIMRAFRADERRRALEHGRRTDGSSARPSSSARTSSSRPSRSGPTRCASRTVRSPGGSRSASTRPESRPSGRTSCR